MANKYGYLAKNTIVFTISSFGSNLLTFVMVPFYTNVLSTSEYGTADMITTSSNLLFFAVSICISDAVLRFAIEGENTRYGVFRFGLKVILWGNIIFGLLLSFVLILNPLKWDISLYSFL